MRFSLFVAFWYAVFKKRGSTHTTLLEKFAYPRTGTGMVYERMAGFVETKGGKIFYKAPVEKINVENQVANSLVLVSGSTYGKYDHIILTMPISLLISRMEHVPRQVKDAAASLRFRNTILVYLNVDALNLFPDQWIYVQSPEFKVGRITNFRNWTPQLYGNEKSTILAMEYWCNDQDDIWKVHQDKIIKLAIDEFQAMDFPRAEVLDGHVEKIRKCYPVYAKGYKEKLMIIRQYLKTVRGLSVIGRYGSFKYNNQDHSILMGLQAAANITKGEHHDLWGINTDYEDYQESFVITETGLVKE